MTHASTPGFAPAAIHPMQRRWMHALAMGGLWGLAASLMESVVLPVGDGHWSTFGMLVLWNIPILVVMGMSFAVAIEWAGARSRSTIVLVLTVTVGAAVLSALWSWVLSAGAASGLASGIATIFPQGRDPLASYLYQTWVIVFYGGLYVVAWKFNQRTERTRQAFAGAEIARVQTETLLGEARLQSLRGYVAPQFLLRVMSEVENRYARSPAGADRLVGLLVGFLRLAMPGVRSGHSTLADEIELARAYTDLWRDLEPHRRHWTIDAPAPIPALPFPPLLLLPILDQVATVSASGAGGRMALALADGTVTLAFEGDGIEAGDLLAPALSYRIGVGLATLFGNGWSLSPRQAGAHHGSALVLAIDSTAGPGSATLRA